MYLPLSEITPHVGNPTNINKIINFCNSPEVYKLETWGKNEKVALTTLRDIVAKNPKLGQSKLTKPSWADDATYPPEGMQACVFVNKKNEQIVSFLGTPSGSWLDNAKEMMGLPPEQSGCEIFTDADGHDFVVSPMQKKAYVRDTA